MDVSQQSGNGQNCKRNMAIISIGVSSLVNWVPIIDHSCQDLCDLLKNTSQ